MRWSALPLLFLVVCSIAPAAECPASDPVLEFFGTIGKDLAVSMTLTFQNGRVSGSYKYLKYERNIPLREICTDGSLTLQESGPPEKLAAFLQGSFSKPQTVEGTWSTVDGKKRLTFQLQALLPKDRVSGRYTMGNYLVEKSNFGAELNILLLADGRVRVKGDAVWVNPAKPDSVQTAEVNGTARLEGDKAHYMESSDDPESCHFTIHFSAGAITVTDDSLKCGGMNVRFAGTYQRVGPPSLDRNPDAV
jgi:hypothetical protein